MPVTKLPKQNLIIINDLHQEHTSINFSVGQIIIIVCILLPFSCLSIRLASEKYKGLMITTVVVCLTALVASFIYLAGKREVDSRAMEIGD